MSEQRIPTAAFRSLSINGGEAVITTQGATLPSPEAQPVPAPSGPVWRADDAADQVALNWHPNFSGYHDRPEARQLFLDTGVRYWRGAVGAAANPTADSQYLYDQAGRKGIILVAPFDDSSGVPVFDKGKVTRFLNHLRGKPWALAVEGANEANKNAASGAAAAPNVLEIQKHVFDTVKADGALRHLTVLGPSTYRRLTDFFDALAGSGHVDASALHTYNDADPPLVAEVNRGTTITLDQLLALTKKIDSSKPLWVTEFNWSSGSGDLRPTGFHLPEEIAASYMLRFHLLTLQRGIPKAAIYALFDQDGGASNFGLVSVQGTGSTATFTPRRSFHAIRRYMRLMSDPAPPATPQGLVYRLEGDLANIQQMLFARGDGTHILAVWQEVAEWNKVLLTSIKPVPRALSLVLPAPKWVAAHRPVVDDASTLIGAGTRIAVAVPSDPLFLHIA